MKTTNSQKKSDRPKDIKTKWEDVAVGLDELIMFLGQRTGVLLYDSSTDIEAIACDRVHDLPYYVVENKMFPKDIAEECFIILSVTVLDAEDLPYEIDPDEELFVIYDEWDFSRYDNMAEAVRNIEYTIKTYPNAVIEDFIVMVGRELMAHAKQAFINKINYWRDVGWGEHHGH